MHSMQRMHVPILARPNCETREYVRTLIPLRSIALVQIQVRNVSNLRSVNHNGNLSWRRRPGRLVRREECESVFCEAEVAALRQIRSEEHTSELQSPYVISYA